MSGMSRKEILAIAEHVQEQGVVITRTTKGLMLRMPDGRSTMIHWTTSDHRARANLSSDLHRSGISLPDEKRPLKEPAYMRRKPTKQSMENVHRAIAALGNPRTLTGTTLARAMWALDHDDEPDAANIVSRTQTGLAALYRLGWQPKLAKGGQIVRSWKRPLTAAEIEAEFAPEPDTPDITDTDILRSQLPEADEPDPAPIEREFLDTVNSWTVDLHPIPPTMTLADLHAVYAAAGLTIELRVWRASPEPV